MRNEDPGSQLQLEAMANNLGAAIRTGMVNLRINARIIVGSLLSRVER
jgi:hypothetical protein